MPYKQQGVVQLRPSDMIRVVQNGADKLLLIQSVIDAIKAMAQEMMAGPVTAVNDHFDVIDNEITTTILNILNAAPPIGKYVDATGATTTTRTGMYPARLKATVTAGIASFTLKDDAGNDLFPNFVDVQSALFRAEEGNSLATSAQHAFGQVSYNSTTKVLSVPVAKTGAAITVALLGLTLIQQNVAANGSVVYATVWGK